MMIFVNLVKQNVYSFIKVVCDSSTFAKKTSSILFLHQKHLCQANELSLPIEFFFEVVKMGGVLFQFNK